MSDIKRPEIDLRTASADEVNRLMRLGVRDALRRHKEAGVPAVVWQDGRIVLLLPEQINIPDEDTGPEGPHS
jgi:hypothetical protein